MGKLKRAFVDLSQRFSRLDLSVIVPVYNAVPYFEECLDSIFSQEFDPERYEVLLIDDGSNDGSESLCDDAARLHSNVRVIHQSNSGECSRPRNNGLDLARGRYVFFCDADDYFYPDAFERMIEHAEASKCDIGLFKIDARDWGTAHAGLFARSREHCTMGDTNLVDFFGSYRLIKRSLIEANGIRFVEGISPEDWAFSLECYLNAENICIFADQYYYKWRKRPDGKSLTMGGTSALVDDWKTMFNAHKAYLDVAVRYGVINEYPLIMQRLCRYTATLVREASRSQSEQLMAYRSLIAPYYSDAVRSVLPFSVLVSNDAFVNGVPVTALKDVISFEDRIRFEKDSEGFKYRIFNREGEAVVESVMPAESKYDLASPRVSFCVVESVNNDAMVLRFSGRLFLLRSVPEPIEAAEIRISIYNQDTEFSIPAKLSSVKCEDAFDKVWEHRLTWESIITIDELYEHCDRFEERVRADIHLVVYLGSSKESFRLGANRTTEAEESFMGLSLPRLISNQTGFKNFSFFIEPRITERSLSLRSC